MIIKYKFSTHNKNNKNSNYIFNKIAQIINKRILIAVYKLKIQISSRNNNNMTNSTINHKQISNNSNNKIRKYLIVNLIIRKEFF